MGGEKLHNQNICIFLCWSTGSSLCPNTRKTLRNESEFSGGTPRWPGTRHMPQEQRLEELGLFTWRRGDPRDIVAASKTYEEVAEEMEPSSSQQHMVGA